jgi:E3 ubiquitin-protein ligase HUWE1
LDPEYYKNLHWILSNNVLEHGLELTFSSDVDNFGEVEIVDLKPNGRNIPVTDENKVTSSHYYE